MPAETAPSPSPPLAARIRTARELRGKTQREVVEDMGYAISGPALSQIESGKMRPSESTVAALAAALDVPAGFFSVHRREAERPVTYFRDLRATTVRERRRAAAQALLLSDLVAALSQYVRLPEVDIPAIPAARGATREEIDEVATRVRRVWGLGSQPIPHVVRELERHGVVVARLTMGHESVDAFSTQIGFRPLVLLTDDKSDNYVRSRFDASHELAHLVMHDDAEPGAKETERQAQDFAASFLLPEEVAYESLPSRIDATGWSRLAELKRTWGISMGALLFRAKSLRIISLDAYQSAMRYMTSRGWRTQEPGDQEMGAPEAPLLLERSIRRATIEAGVSEETFIRHAHLPPDDLLELLEAAVDDRPVVEL